MTDGVMDAAIAHPAPRTAPPTAIPMVSVLMVAYNHEPFIAQALDSVLMQRVDFPYEIVVGEDCSTDGTRAILLAYQRRHPDRIRLLLREANVGMMPNYLESFAACHGRYIAMLDGDDYWTVGDKLQRQIDFMEQHPECAFSFHNAVVCFEDGRTRPYFAPDRERPATIEDLMSGNHIPTCSVIYRNGLVTQFPTWLVTQKMEDWPMYVLYAEQGAIGYVPGTMATYRVHQGGVWSRLRLVGQLANEIEMLEMLDQHLRGRYRRQVRRSQAERTRLLAIEHANAGERGAARAQAILTLKRYLGGRRRPDSLLASVLLRAFAPPVHRAAQRGFKRLARQHG